MIDAKKLIKDIENTMYRVPAEFCTDNKTIDTYLKGRIHERQEIVNFLKEIK